MGVSLERNTVSFAKLDLISNLQFSIVLDFSQISLSGHLQWVICL
jgi:hypothetical protein